MTKKITDAVILAAGSGKRFKKTLPKQFIKIFNKSSIEISIEKLLKVNSIRNIYLTINKKHESLVKKLPKEIKIINGGRTRTISVLKSLDFINSQPLQPHNVLIHDAVRPCVSDYDIKKIMNNANTLVTGMALGYPLTHALKIVNTKMNVIDNIDKKDMWLAFTPQLFNFKKIYNSYKKVVESKLKIDDDIQAMSFLSYKVNLLFSSYKNIKLTYLDDIDVIKNLLR